MKFSRTFQLYFHDWIIQRQPLTMRRSRRTLNELVVELSQAPIRPNICAQCNYVFNYPKDAPWSEAFQIVCEHWKICLSGMSGEAVPSRGEEVTNEGRGSPSPTIASEDTLPPAKRTRTTSQSPAGPSRRRKKNVMDKGSRRQLIERDLWARNATAKSVECKGCGRTIKLDKRSDYYPGLWHKHRNKCPAIRRLESKGEGPKKDADVTAIEERMRCSTTNQTLSLSREINTRKSETHERISRWTTSAGLRYHAVSSCSASGDMSRSASPSEDDGSYPDVLSASVLRHVGARNTTKNAPEQDAERARTDNVKYSDDDEYWRAAPFGPDKATIDASESASGRRLYRYSTRRELITKYMSPAFQGRKASESYSEDVMQAARCLVSMKSRTPV